MFPEYSLSFQKIGNVYILSASNYRHIYGAIKFFANISLWLLLARLLLLFEISESYVYICFFFCKIFIFYIYLYLYIYYYLFYSNVILYIIVIRKCLLINVSIVEIFYAIVQR